ncbi:MAG: pseudouridine synthase [Alphaproteobacteria bacterium]|jgi:23S rRNA pseudouridine2605 synthase|nr:rRNA pseudouridine synthase [Candidatus Jidaibacter sp.]
MSEIQKKETVRIAKYIASSGKYSRREAERLIVDLRVKLNGKIVEDLGRQVAKDDIILVDDEPITPELKEKIWLFYKPRGCICSRSDEQGRKTIYDVLPKEMAKVHLVGRLDYNTEGLIILTNSPAIKRHMEMPSSGMIRKYKVRILGSISDDMRANLEKGITHEGMKYKPCKVKVLLPKKPDAINTWLEISLSEGKYREIRNMMDFAGCQVNRLIRTAYGQFSLGDMHPYELKSVD